MNNPARDMRNIISQLSSLMKESNFFETPSWYDRGEDVADPSKVNDDCNDFLEPDEWDWMWRICEVPIDIIDVPTPDFHDEERMERLRSETLHSPIIAQLESNGGVRLIDGYHRMKVAKERGQYFIMALVGKPQN